MILSVTTLASADFREGSAAQFVQQGNGRLTTSPPLGNSSWNHRLMRVRRLASLERTARQILGRALAGTGWSFLMKARAQDVLERQEKREAA